MGATKKIPALADKAGTGDTRCHGKALGILRFFSSRVRSADYLFTFLLPVILLFLLHPLHRQPCLLAIHFCRGKLQRAYFSALPAINSSAAIVSLVATWAARLRFWPVVGQDKLPTVGLEKKKNQKSPQGLEDIDTLSEIKGACVLLLSQEAQRTALARSFGSNGLETGSPRCAAALLDRGC